MVIIVNVGKNRKGFILEELRCKIECLRQRMHVVALEKGISHPEVLMISQKLDAIMNELYKADFLKKKVG